MNASGAAPAGWHPDPSDPSGGLRWWDGDRWTQHVRPRPVGGASDPTAGTWPPAGGGAPPATGTPLRSWRGSNEASVTALVVTAVYVALAATTRVYFLGILPVLMGYRAVRRKEPLAALAVVAAVVALVVGVGLWRPN